MPNKKSVKTKFAKREKTGATSFAKFLSDPLIATALIVFALVALVLSILEFSKATAL